MRALLIVLLITVTGCATVHEQLPQPPNTFADYQASTYERTDPARARAPLPIGVCSAAGVDAVAFDEAGFALIEELEAAHAANVQIIIELDQALAAKYAEVAALVQAGRMAEYTAEIYLRLYESERRRGALRLLGLGGVVTAGALIGLGTGL